MFDECLKCNHREVGEGDVESCELTLVGSEIGGCSAFVAAGDPEAEGPMEGSTETHTEVSTESPMDQSDPSIPEITATVVLKDKEEKPEATVEPEPTQEISPAGIASEEVIGPPGPVTSDDPEPLAKDKN